VAITATHIESDISDANASSYLTGTRTPTANCLQVIDVELSDSNPILAPAVTGCGLTWVHVDGVEYDTAGTRHAVHRFRALGASPTTGQLTITPTEALLGCGWSWAEYDGIDTSGTNGSGAIVQTVVNNGTGTTLSATLAAFGDAANGVSAGLSTDGDSVFTAGTGYAILGQDVSASASPTASIGQEWRADNDTTPDATIGSSAQWGIIASELKAAPVVPSGGFPDVAFFLALGDDPLEASPTWTEIPANFVERITFTSSGRSLDLEDFVGGSGSVVLRNHDGRFTPGNDASPYSPNIRLRMPFKVEATRDSDTLTIRGYVNATPVKIRDNNAALCEWPLVDAFTLLDAADGEYPWRMVIRHDGPQLWVNYDELSGTTVLDDSGNGYHGTYVGGPTMQVEFGTGTAVTFDGITQSADFPASASITGTGDFWIEFYGDVSVTGTDQVIYSQWDYAISQGIRLFILAAGTVHLQTTDGSGSTTVTGSTNVASSPETHVLVRREGTTHEIRVNGSVDGTTTGTARDIPAVVISAPGVSADVTMDSLITGQGTLTSDEADRHFQAFLAWHALPAGLTIDYALDAFGWPDADRDIDNNASQVLGQFDPGGSVLDMLRLVATSDFGALYVTLDGIIRFRRRQAIMAAPYTISQGMFGPNDIPVVVEGLELDYDASRIKNDVTLKVNWQTGPIETAPYQVTVRKTDAASIAAYGAQTYSRDVYTMVSGGTGETAVLLGSLAAYVLGRYKDPLREIRELTLHPTSESSDDLWEAVLLRSQEDRITHEHTMPGGEIISGDYHIQRIRHEIGPGKRWRTVWTVSPADTLDYWVLGSATLGESTRLGV
jgi:hypothetical protein